ncbi:histidine kinase [Nocardia zapadnayensis]|uniref:sensor histidine kinase n=1 Tax=Nocardia rhamnosiphila TaxID=426716 RepID=UPI0022478007|nr:histidine kinase [Nocardia zapadnayensis]MCX0269178.1 histidine kinase [Nocardia zapadnayensis]
MRTFPQQGARRCAAVLIGTLLGALTVVLDLAAAVSGLFVAHAWRRAVRVEQRRLGLLLGSPPVGEPTGGRALGYLSVRIALGLLATVVLALICAGVVIGVALIYGASTGAAVPVVDATEPGQISWKTVAWVLPPGMVFAFLTAQGLLGVIRAEAWAWRVFALPGTGELAERVARLTATRAEMTEVIDEERRRIERDLHDGVQQRVVALSIALARVDRETDPGVRADLHRRARAETGQLLDDLRDVSWRIYPAMLARDGLHATLEALADRTPLPTRLAVDLPARPPRAVESACYFTASEAITNAIKHSGAATLEIAAGQTGATLWLRVHDDGHGGADPAGHGLSGIAARIHALDGTFTLDSPVGGPTTITAEVPCG